MGKPAFVDHTPVENTRTCGIQEERPLDDQKTGNSNWERGRGIQQKKGRDHKFISRVYSSEEA
jgi:hypothetical protein